LEERLPRRLVIPDRHRQPCLQRQGGQKLRIETQRLIRGRFGSPSPFPRRTARWRSHTHWYPARFAIIRLARVHQNAQHINNTHATRPITALSLVHFNHPIRLDVRHRLPHAARPPDLHLRRFRLRSKAEANHRSLELA
jgi:hypothetical protein